MGGPRKAISLLAYLILHAERTLSRAALAEQFWPDLESEDARASLRRHLHRALSALPIAAADRPWILADKVTVRWNAAAAMEIDTRAYERLCDAGDRRAAVALYRGDYLEDFYEEWILPERERLRALQAANLIALVEERRRALDYPEAIAFAQALLRLDPLREDAIRRLMSLRFAAGDRSGALSDFDLFRRTLRDELAAEPMPETLALHEAIRNGDHSMLERRASQTERVAARSGYPFVGRTSALEALRSAWEAAARGAGTTAIVSGEAGVGKSRLIGELMALAESQGGRVFAGSTATVEAEPYQSVAEVLRVALPLLRVERLDASEIAGLSSLLPEVRDRVPHPPPLVPLEPEQERRRAFDAVERALERLAEKRPVLVVLEDAHWAGSASIELIEHLARRLRDTFVLLVVSFREEDGEGRASLGALLRRLDLAQAKHVPLGPLGAADVHEIVATVAPGRDGTFADELFEASEGNALFVTELLRERLTGTDRGAIPASVAETVVARVNRLAPAARSLVEAAAVVGTGFDADVLRQVCGWSFSDAFDALDELIDRALVRTSSHRRGELSFSHQLVHAAVYDGIDPAGRRLLHRRVAKTLDRLFEGQPSLFATVARHYDAAGLASEAVPRFLSAARYALAVYAQADTIALASRALELQPAVRDRFELLRLREDAEAMAGDSNARGRDCAELLEVARELAETDALGLALVCTFKLRLQLAERGFAAAAVADLLALAARSESPRWIVEAAICNARLAIDRSENTAAEAAFAEAESVAESLPDAELAVEYWSQRAFNAVWTDLDRARAFLEHARQRAGDDRTFHMKVLRAEVHVANVAGDAPSLRRAASDLLDRSRKMGDLEGQATAHRSLASAAWYGFDVIANRDHTMQALALYERLRKPSGVAACVGSLGNLALFVGDTEGAQVELQRALEAWRALDVPINVCYAMHALAMVAIARDDIERAHALAAENVAFARLRKLEREEANALDLLGLTERELGMLDLAREHKERALAWRREHNPRYALESLIELIPVYERLGLHEKAAAGAAELYEAVHRDTTCVSFPAQALAVAASAFASIGDIERARAVRDESRSVLHSIAARIDDEASRAGYVASWFHREVHSAT